MVCIWLNQEGVNVEIKLFLSKIIKGGDLIVKTFLLCWNYYNHLNFGEEWGNFITAGVISTC